MKTDIDTSLLERVRKIGPVLKANVAEGERLRRLPQESLDALTASAPPLPSRDMLPRPPLEEALAI